MKGKLIIIISLLTIYLHLFTLSSFASTGYTVEYINIDTDEVIFTEDIVDLQIGDVVAHNAPIYIKVDNIEFALLNTEPQYKEITLTDIVDNNVIKYDYIISNKDFTINYLDFDTRVSIAPSITTEERAYQEIILDKPEYLIFNDIIYIPENKESESAIVSTDSSENNIEIPYISTNQSTVPLHIRYMNDKDKSVISEEVLQVIPGIEYTHTASSMINGELENYEIIGSTMNTVLPIYASGEEDTPVNYIDYYYNSVPKFAEIIINYIDEMDNVIYSQTNNEANIGDEFTFSADAVYISDNIRYDINDAIEKNIVVQEGVQTISYRYAYNTEVSEVYVRYYDIDTNETLYESTTNAPINEPFYVNPPGLYTYQSYDFIRAPYYTTSIIVSSNPNENVIEIPYAKRLPVEKIITVNYIDDYTEEILISRTFTSTRGEIFTYNASLTEGINGKTYSLYDDYQKKLIVRDNESDNIINFRYYDTTLNLDLNINYKLEDNTTIKLYTVKDLPAYQEHIEYAPIYLYQGNITYILTDTSVNKKSTKPIDNQSVDFVYKIYTTESEDAGENQQGNNIAFMRYMYNDTILKDFNIQNISTTSYTHTAPMSIIIDGNMYVLTDNQYKNIPLNTVQPVVFNYNLVSSSFVLDYENIAFITGYKDLTFRPDDSITRAELAKIIYSVFGKGTVNNTVNFSDVKSDAWYYDAIAFLSNYNVINGYPDGTFRPDKEITRGEYTALLSRISNISPDNYSMNFKDVSYTSAYYHEIKEVSYAGWLNGYPDKTFRPENNLTRAETVKSFIIFLYRQEFLQPSPIGFNNFYTDITGHWAIDYIYEATINK